ncbi:omptin family outer membrane protease [Paracoccus saliphilus]|uniref:Outer membrane protease n=1 Tax=Paracoccus saliphilus TaxID=405559 RepID=A0AA45W3D5_9RHOB|nr:omptin family outer membrane protease [Paracoccus saliphilus]WCR02453.1 omptin family outer membrane protease [Paracoccus saliphilus]SIS75901.1 Outer membrane protease [Paracoccus saliphilus]
MRHFRYMLVIALFAFAATPVLAEGEDRLTGRGMSHEFQATLGYGRITANELVYRGAGDERLSHLIWEASTLVATLSTRFDLGNAWALSGQAMFGVNGRGDMTDYDWLAPFAKGTSDHQWTDRSQHPDSQLDHYFDLELAVGRDFDLNEATQVNLHGGLKYTWIEWHARGGRYIYSDNNFRDARGSFPDGEVGVSYKQQRRTVFVGAEMIREQGDWRLSGLLRAGLSVNPKAVDHHWLRNIRFDERFSSSPFFQIGLAAERQLENQMWLHVGAGYQKFFRERGDTRLSAIRTGQKQGIYDNSVGADLSVATIDIGIRREF